MHSICINTCARRNEHVDVAWCWWPDVGGGWWDGLMWYASFQLVSLNVRCPHLVLSMLQWPVQVNVGVVRHLWIQAFACAGWLQGQPRELQPATSKSNSVDLAGPNGGMFGVHLLRLG